MTEWKSLPEQEPAKVGSFFLVSRFERDVA